MVVLSSHADLHVKEPDIDDAYWMNQNRSRVVYKIYRKYYYNMHEALTHIGKCSVKRTHVCRGLMNILHKSFIHATALCSHTMPRVIYATACPALFSVPADQAADKYWKSDAMVLDRLKQSGVPPEFVMKEMGECRAECCCYARHTVRVAICS